MENEGKRLKMPTSLVCKPPICLTKEHLAIGIIAVNFFWNCDLSWRSDCEPQLSPFGPLRRRI